MDFLADFATRETPQFIYDSTTYDIEVLKLKNGYKGAAIEIVERTVI